MLALFANLFHKVFESLFEPIQPHNNNHSVDEYWVCNACDQHEGDLLVSEEFIDIDSIESRLGRGARSKEESIDICHKVAPEYYYRADDRPAEHVEIVDHEIVQARFLPSQVPRDE